MGRHYGPTSSSTSLELGVSCREPSAGRRSHPSPGGPVRRGRSTYVPHCVSGRECRPARGRLGSLSCLCVAVLDSPHRKGRPTKHLRPPDSDPLVSTHRGTLGELLDRRATRCPVEVSLRRGPGHPSGLLLLPLGLMHLPLHRRCLRIPSGSSFHVGDERSTAPGS